MLLVLYAALGVPSREILDACAFITFATTALSGVHYVLAFTRRAWMLPARSS
jgi:hypothetical protein